MKVAINKELPVTNLKSYSEEFIYHVEEPEDYDSDEEIKGDNVDESNTMIPPEAIPVITVFTDVFTKDRTPIPLEVTPVNTEFVESLLKTSLARYHRCVISNTSLI